MLTQYTLRLLRYGFRLKNLITKSLFSVGRPPLSRTHRTIPIRRTDEDFAKPCHPPFLPPRSGLTTGRTYPVRYRQTDAGLALAQTEDELAQRSILPHLLTLCVHGDGRAQLRPPRALLVPLGMVDAETLDLVLPFVEVALVGIRHLLVFAPLCLVRLVVVAIVIKEPKLESRILDLRLLG